MSGEQVRLSKEVKEDGSVYGAITAIFAQAERTESLELPVWWSDELPSGTTVVVRFGLVPRRRLTELAQAGSLAGPIADIGRADLLIIAESCTGILIEDGAGLRSLDPTGETVIFGPRLGEICGWEAEDAADAVEQFYRLDRAPLALAGVTRPLIDWLGGARARGHRQAMGESAAAG